MARVNVAADDVARVNVAAVNVAAVNMANLDVAAIDNVAHVDMARVNVARVDVAADNVAHVDVAAVDNVARVDMAVVDVAHVAGSHQRGCCRCGSRRCGWSTFVPPPPCPISSRPPVLVSCYHWGTRRTLTGSHQRGVWRVVDVAWSRCGMVDGECPHPST